MRWNVRILPVLVVALTAVATSWAWAQNPPDQARPGPGSAPAPAQAEGQVQGQAAAQPAPVDPKKLEQLLGLWEQNSSRLKHLDVEMTRTDKSEAWGENERYEGRAMLKTPNLAWLDFKKEVEVVDPKTKEKKKQYMPHERIICTGNEVWQYRSDTRQIFIFPLEKEAQQRALEEGPLPFLFNFKVAEAQKRYQMFLYREDENSYTILIIPRLPIDRESFTKALVLLDRKNFLLPSRIYLIAPDGKSSKDFVLKLTEDCWKKEVMDVNFVGEEVKGWQVVRNPGGDAKPGPVARPVQPAPAAAAANAKAKAKAGASEPVQQPAMRPRGIFGGRRN